jgi:ribosomal protein S19
MRAIINSNKKRFNSLEIPFIKFNFLKKILKRKNLKKKFYLYKLSVQLFSFFAKKQIFLYNGKKYNQFLFSKRKLFRIIGEFITTRIINSGKILHKRKKK